MASWPENLQTIQNVVEKVASKILTVELILTAFISAMKTGANVYVSTGVRWWELKQIWALSTADGGVKLDMLLQGNFCAEIV